jgi:hypothetical protein
MAVLMVLLIGCCSAVSSAPMTADPTAMPMVLLMGCCSAMTLPPMTADQRALPMAVLMVVLLGCELGTDDG